ncbi:hypothetical protein LZ554_003893 [Drepanopeziza brunnea f. sp. 'monogermtubi']|nr:hypothetical protein LZ554_003893 [Drepanopeziza brunnea f. sp. 'monogermtubi']
MPPNNAPKPRRHKKRKSRTTVESDISSSSDSEPAGTTTTMKKKKKSVSPSPTIRASNTQTRAQGDSSSSSEETPEPTSSLSNNELTDAQISKEFTQFYMERATREFEDDLEKLRTSEDFKSESLPILIAALQAGASLFSAAEKRRVVVAGREVEGVKR